MALIEAPLKLVECSINRFKISIDEDGNVAQGRLVLHRFVCQTCIPFDIKDKVTFQLAAKDRLIAEIKAVVKHNVNKTICCETHN